MRFHQQGFDFLDLLKLQNIHIRIIVSHSGEKKTAQHGGNFVWHLETYGAEILKRRHVEQTPKCRMTLGPILYC